MDRLKAMQVFSKVVELDSFARAADALSLGRGTVSAIVRKLEENLRTRLIQRTTRQLSLTPEGLEYYRHCARVLGDVADAEKFLSSGKGPSGRLNVHMPTWFGRLVIAPRIGDFRERFPNIDLAIELGERPEALVRDGIDCTISVGDVRNPGFVQIRLGELPVATAASPEYLLKHGEPQHVEELNDHFAVQYLARRGRTLSFKFVIEGSATEVQMRSALSVSDAETYVICGATGAGVIQAPRLVMAPYFRSGALVEILSWYKPPSLSIAAVYPNNRHRVSSLRAFVDWAAAQLHESAFAKAERVTALSVG